MKLTFEKQASVRLVDMVDDSRGHVFNWHFRAWEAGFSVLRIRATFAHLTGRYDHQRCEDDCAVCRAIVPVEPLEVLVECQDHEDVLTRLVHHWDEFNAACKAAAKVARKHLERAWAIDAGRLLAEKHRDDGPMDCPWMVAGWREKLAALYKDDLGKRAVPDPRWPEILELIASAADARRVELADEAARKAQPPTVTAQVPRA